MHPLLAQTTPGMQFNRKGSIVVQSEKTGGTTKNGVFAGGDIVTGAATAIKAAGAGRDAGMAIDKFLKDGEWWDPNAPPPPAAAPAAPAPKQPATKRGQISGLFPDEGTSAKPSSRETGGRAMLSPAPNPVARG